MAQREQYRGFAVFTAWQGCCCGILATVGVRGYGFEGGEVRSRSGETTQVGAALGQLAANFEDLLEAMPDALVGVDRAGVIRFVNNRAETLFGYDRGALVGQLIEMLVPEPFRMAHKKLRAEYIAGPKTRSMGTDPKFVGVRRDGTELPLDISLSNLQTGEGPFMIAAVRDMSARKESEEVRRHSDRLMAAIEFSGDAIMTGTLEGIITSWNRSAERLFGYTSGEMIGQSADLLSPEDRIHEVDAAIAKIISGQPVAKIETTGVRKDSTVFPVALTFSGVFGQDGALVGASAIARDVTEQSETFAAVERMASIVENSDDAIVGKTLDGIVTSWNPAAERMYGYTSEEMMGRSIELLSPVDETGEIRSILARIRDGHRVERLDTIRIRKDGRALNVSMSVSPIHDPNGKIVGASAIARDVTEARQANEAAQRMALVVESSGEAIITCTLKGRITSFNPAAVRMFGYGMDEAIGTSMGLLSRQRQGADSRALLAKITAERHTENLETVGVRRDGTEFPVFLNASAIRDEAGEPVGLCLIVRDVTEQKRAAEIARSLTAAEDLVRTVLGSAAIGIALAGLDGFFQVVNASICDLLGHDEVWFLTRRIRDMAHPEDVDAVLQERARLLSGSTDKGAASLRLVRADGTTVWVRYVAVLIRDANGQPNAFMVQVEDITAEHDAQEALAHQAIHDPLTGLHNRAWVLDILQSDLRTAKRLGTSVGTMFVDLDNFKLVNDSLGHRAGDEVIATVAQRIVAALRPGDRVGRFGGDSFVIVLENVRDVLEVERCAERVSTSIAVDLQVHGHRIVPTTSIGIALSTSTSTPESLLRDTDSALHRAKNAGRGRWQFFDTEMHTQAVNRLTVEDQLRDAITRGEFVVHYQPIVALADARVVGHEALVRWAHPARGLLSPGEFLDVAEESGLISAIGAQVLDQACAMLAARTDLPGPISVNVSAVQLASPEWLRSVTGTLTLHRVDPARLVVEVTETAALSVTDSALQALESLSRLGVGVHLDDFGTGYSSISVLRDLPVTGVKLDLRFVHDLTAGPSQANALAHGLSGLVDGMHLTGIAEGIETELQADILRAQGWECGQGYFFGRPAAMSVGDQKTDDELIA
jgi:diguanylate cyclase (GGDEF)-like protein/PAS domain S-box-containing protein